MSVVSDGVTYTISADVARKKVFLPFVMRWSAPVSNTGNIQISDIFYDGVAAGEADVDHADAVWEAIVPFITDEFAVRTALEGAAASYKVDAAYRAAVGHTLRSVSG